MDKKVLKEHLVKTFCYKCGSSLDGASVVPISEVPIAMTAYVTCPNCKAESMITITLGGAGVFPIATDLTPEEMKNFFSQKEVSIDDVLELHKLLKKETLWNLLHKQEQNLEKRAKKSEKSAKSQP